MSKQASFGVFLQLEQVRHNIIQYTDYSIHKFLRFYLGAKQTFGKKEKAIPRFNYTILKQPALTGHGRIDFQLMTLCITKDKKTCHSYCH